MSIVNNTAANIGIDSLNPLSDLRTEVEGFQNFSKEIPIYKIKSFLKSMKIAIPGMLSKYLTFIMSLTSPAYVLADVSVFNIPGLVFLY